MFIHCTEQNVCFACEFTDVPFSLVWTIGVRLSETTCYNCWKKKNNFSTSILLYNLIDRNFRILDFMAQKWSKRVFQFFSQIEFLGSCECLPQNPICFQTPWEIVLTIFLWYKQVLMKLIMRMTFKNSSHYLL